MMPVPTAPSCRMNVLQSAKSNNALDCIMPYRALLIMEWVVEIGDEFEPEFYELDEAVRTEILAHARLLQQFGRNWADHVWIRLTAPARKHKGTKV